MATVTLEKVKKIYHRNTVAVEDFNLHIEDGEFIVLVGPSGCGKSTTLRLIAGLEEMTGGEIYIDGTLANDLPPKDRDIAMVFQNYALYPHMTVGENMGFGLRIAGEDKSEIKRRVQDAAKILDLTDYLDRKPKALSGGQRQRVAMGRAIVRKPQVFLMDEPLSNLDAKLRVQTRAQISALQRRLGTTTVYVTHDQVEAMTMGDRVAVLKDGVLQQCDTPRRMYEHPDNVFVAGFIGSPAMNLLELPLVDGGVSFGGDIVPVPRASVAGIGESTVTLGVRPEDLEITTGSHRGLEVTIDVIEELGADAYVYGQADVNGKKQPIVVRADGRIPPRRGEVITLSYAAERTHLFSTVTGERLVD